MTVRPDPTFHATAKLAMQAPPEKLAFTPVAGRLATGRPGSRRCRSRVQELWRGGPHRRDAACRRRVSPFRLERLLRRALAHGRACASGAPFPDHPRHPVEPDLHHRHQAEPDRGQDPQDHRTRGAVREDRLLPPPHGPLRARGRVYLNAGRRRPRRHRRPAGRVHHGLRDLRDSGPLWELDRGPQKLHYDFWWNLPRDYMVTRNGACRRNTRTASSPRICWPTNTAIRCISGICARAATSRPSISAPITRWRWRCGRRMTRPRNTASSASWSTPRTCRARSGPGGARTASSTSRRPR
jgi:hypothetical protein